MDLGDLVRVANRFGRTPDALEQYLVGDRFLEDVQCADFQRTDSGGYVSAIDQDDNRTPGADSAESLEFFRTDEIAIVHIQNYAAATLPGHGSEPRFSGGECLYPKTR